MNMQSAYKYNFHQKYHTKEVGFWNAFLNFFGLRNNPYDESLKHMVTRSDLDALRSDWDTVGQDFCKVIEKENLTLDAHK